MKLTKPRLVLVLLLGATILFASIPSPNRSIPGRVIRFCLGEPAATQGVNDAANMIISLKWESDLQQFAVRMIREFDGKRTELPESFMGGSLLPVAKLPERYLDLNGPVSAAVGAKPELALRDAEGSQDRQVVIDWAHMRHAIVIYEAPPKTPPGGFYVRKVNECIYVVAGHS